MIGNIFLGILAFFFLEIYVGIQAIHAFGFANVFFAGLTSFILGIGLFRTSSLRLSMGVAQAVREGRPPGLAALDGALIGLAGVLFIIPGFVSDAFAILLLIPFLRKWVAHRVVNAIAARQAGAVGRSSSAPENFDASDASSAVIDVDAVVVEDKQLPRGK